MATPSEKLQIARQKILQVFDEAADQMQLPTAHKDSICQNCLEAVIDTARCELP